MKTPAIGEAGVTAFRTRLLAAMALVVGGLTVLTLYFMERSVRAETRHDLQGAFASELALLRTSREARHAMLSERCRALVREPRIHAALEENTLDLLYPSAREELGDAPVTSTAPARQSAGVRFYRFLDVRGAVIAPLDASEVGALTPGEENQLGFAGLPREQQSGYLEGASGEIVEVFATPIFSAGSGGAIAALVAGFSAPNSERPAAGLQSGFWFNGRLHLPGLAEAARTDLGETVARAVAGSGNEAANGFPVRVNGVEHMLFCERLNPGSLFPPAYGVGLYPLTKLLDRQRELRLKAAIAGAVLLALGIATSYAISARLAAPVRELAAVSAENRLLRERAEKALAVTSAELERTARFSADASHQLKTPVAVLRAGLEELLSREDLDDAQREELAVLVHQTFRLTGIIEDLLLLSRLDSGRLELQLSPLDLNHLVETCVDDLHLLNDTALPREVRLEMEPDLRILGEKRYTMLILDNLLENARKYGRADSPIRVAGRKTQGGVVLSVVNAGPPIPEPSWERLFERFHRGAVGENIPGHGLGLNLARVLARLHGGELRLVRSDEQGTEFEVRFRSAPMGQTAATGVAV